MSQAIPQATALHIATYSGWYRFAARDGSWEKTHKALTFWKLTSLQVDPEDAGHVYVATEHSGLFVSRFDCCVRNAGVLAADERQILGMSREEGEGGCIACNRRIAGSALCRVVN